MCTNVELQWNEPTHLQHNRCKPWCWPTEDLYSLDFYLMDVEISMYRESRSISEYCSTTKNTFLGEAGVAFQNYSLVRTVTNKAVHTYFYYIWTAAYTTWKLLASSRNILPRTTAAFILNSKTWNAVAALLNRSSCFLNMTERLQPLPDNIYCANCVSFIQIQRYQHDKCSLQPSILAI